MSSYSFDLRTGAAVARAIADDAARPEARRKAIRAGISSAACAEIEAFVASFLLSSPSG